MGFAAGFQVGAQAVERGLKMREEDKLKRELAQAYAKPEEFVDYTPEQQRQIQGLQAAGGYDVQAVPGAEGQAPTLRYSARPGSMYYDDMGQPEAPIEVAPQRVQRYGGQTVVGQFDPMQLQGLQMREAARVVGASGDPVRAAQMLAEATRIDRDAEDRAYQARIRPLQEEQMKRQGLLTEGQIKAMNKTQERETKLEAVDTEVAQWQSKRLLDPNTNEPRQSTPDDDIAALQFRATALRKAGLAKEATESLKDYQGFAVNQIKLDETQRNSQLGAVAAALATGDLEPARAFYDRFVLDGAKVTAMKADPKTGAITVSRVRDDGTALPDRTIKGGANELLASLNSFRDPMSLYTFSQNEFNNNLKTKELGIRQESLQLQKNSQALAEDTAAFNKMQGIADSARKDIVLNRPVVSGIKTFKNSAGEAVLVDTSKLEQNPDGTLKLPKGLTLATTRTEPTDAAVAKLAADIMKDRKQWPMVKGKPVAPSPEQAGAMARAVLRKNAAVVDENESPEDKLIRLMQASQQAQ
jgi:hypothetical protein